MDRRNWARLAAVPLLSGAGLVGPVAPAAVAAPAPVTPAAADELYVSSKDCAPGGDGGMDAPYCTISAAAAVAQPGQTVLVQPGNYPEAVSVTRSGTEGAPITFRAVNGPDGLVNVGNTVNGVVTGAVFTVSAVHDVVVEGFRLMGTSEKPLVLVDGSHRVVVDGITGTGIRAPGTVQVTGGSGDVTVSRNFLSNLPGSWPSVAVDPGVTGAVVVANQLAYGGVLVSDAPGTSVVNNTVLANCRTGVDVTGTSPGVAVQNNIVRTNFSRQACAIPANATAIAVSAASVEGTVADHNLIDPISGGALYSWSGTAYQNLASFQEATGQGGHDLAADPLLGAQTGGNRAWWPLDPASPAVDSGDATAKGVTRTDFLGNPHSDNPAVANSGTGAGYHDRGAVEAQGHVTDVPTNLVRKTGTDPLVVTATAVPKYVWPVDGQGGSIAYRFGGDRFWRVTDARALDRSLRRAGTACVEIHTSFVGFRDYGTGSTSKHCTVVGAHYAPVAPTRLLDTRAAVGTATTTPVAANSEVVLSIPNIGEVPATDISAVVLNVTVTKPTAAGFVTVYPDGATTPSSSNVNFVAAETVANLATVSMSNGKIRLRHTGSGTVHLIADLQGFYGRQGSGFKPLTPSRVLDTRTGAATPIAANGEFRLDLGAKLPADATAAILNVTVTQPTANGVLKVYPDGTPVPTASNLNFVTGQTIPNLVTVPVVAGKVLIRNASSGTTHVVADLAGYFGSAASGATQSFVPLNPVRVADTRTAVGWNPAGPMTGYAYARFWPTSIQTPCYWACPKPTAAVLNLTVTQPTAAGVLTAYPYGEEAPAASNVNFVAEETASNLAVVKVGASGEISAFHKSSGATHVIADQSGYFIAPA
ncbi:MULTISPECIES: right-handed parallel beta-helix repeat-containing protein [unclassified Micromonospora]|uniref:right-handed parallel beta-helix repeat-containing protein n=1 Tax=unclassified Micromonospora TaxID=2617518 RepID=UPI002FF0FF49